ncbi:MAG TPA: PilX N-terminal domain-containing pilus assembly protein [Wenzhouxiangellaceae bacterium]|nr:PilX N-terminal domain-containing pilus assembly protein [Wenzhouxiangellaceae bacterium]
MKTAKYSRYNNVYRQHGAALFISLMFLIILTLIGISAANVGIMQERMAGNVRETNIAFQSAEATLREVEAEVRALVEGTGGSALGPVPTWSEALTTLVIDRYNCTLSDADPGDLPWQTAPDSGYDFAVYKATGGIGPGGLPFGSACSPLVGAGFVPTTEFDNVHIVVARAQGPADVGEEIVQSIFSW